MQEEFWSVKTFKQENNNFFKDIRITLSEWIRIKTGWLPFSRVLNPVSEYGLIINVSVVSNVHTKKFNKLGSVIRDIWLWLDWILIKDKQS